MVVTTINVYGFVAQNNRAIIDSDSPVCWAIVSNGAFVEPGFGVDSQRPGCACALMVHLAPTDVPEIVLEHNGRLIGRLYQKFSDRKMPCS